jgi:hypothetical protein
MTKRKLILALVLVLGMFLVQATAFAEETVSDAAPAPHPSNALTGSILNTDKGGIDLSRRPALFLDGGSSDSEALAVFARVYQQNQPYLVALANLQQVEAELAKADIKAQLYTCRGTPPAASILAPALVSVVNGLMVITPSLQVDNALQDLNYPMLIGEASLPCFPQSDPGENNAAVAASVVDGAIVQPGQTFSFLDTVGVPSAARGYQMSKSMISTPDGPGWVADIGGGICKTATVLNLAVEQAGLSITEQHHHSFPVDYVPSGQDTAVDQDSGWDYRFVNSQSQPVKIVASCISNTLQVQLWEL